MPGYRFSIMNSLRDTRICSVHQWVGETNDIPSLSKGISPTPRSRWLSDVDVFDPHTIASHNLNFLLRFRFKMASLSVWDHLRHTFDTTQRWSKVVFCPVIVICTSSLHFRTFVYISAVNAYRHCIVRVKRIVGPYIMVNGYLVKRCQ